MAISKRNTAIRTGIGIGGFISGIAVAFLVFAGVTWISSEEVTDYDNGNVEAATEESTPVDKPEPELDEQEEDTQEVESSDSVTEEAVPATGESVTIGGGAYAFRVPSGYRLASEMVVREGGVVASVTVTKGSTQQGRDYLALVGDGVNVEGGDGIPPFMPGQSIVVSLARVGERDADMQLAQKVSNLTTAEGYDAVHLERVSGANTADVTYIKIDDTLIAVRMYHASSESGFDRASYNALIATVRENS